MRVYAKRAEETARKRACRGRGEEKSSGMRLESYKVTRVVGRLITREILAERHRDIDVMSQSVGESIGLRERVT